MKEGPAAADITRAKVRGIEDSVNKGGESMTEFPTCPGCGVPEMFAQMNRWLDNGDVVQSTNEQARMAFVECEHVDPVFRDVGKAIGISIDHIVINIVARATQLYMDTIILPQVKEMIRNRSLDVPTFSQPILDLCHAMGYGKYTFLGYRYEEDEDDFCKISIYRPFSILETSGAFAGVVASSVGGEHLVTFEEVSPELYELTTHWTTYPQALKEKLQLRMYEPKEGGLALERCATCGTPLLISSTCRWDTENGIIINARTGYRMAELGPGLMDSIFDALEWELGEEIPRLVVDAQRRFARAGFAPIDFSWDEDELRLQFAVRGLGRLRRFRLRSDGVQMHLDNSCMRLLLVGLVQGSFERAFGVDSHVEWEISEEGALQMEIRAG
jgi:hypothetical protein